MQEVKEMEGLVAGVLHGALGTHGIWAFDWATGSELPQVTNMYI
jgi:hypothetical protein